MDVLVRSVTDLQLMGPFVYVLILLLSFAESLVFTGMFVPGTVVIVIAGGLAAHGYYSYWLLVLFATIGAVVGDSISFEFGRRGQMKLQKESILKKHIDRAKPYFKKHQRKSILFGRFFGPLRPVIPFLAGVADMKRSQFYAIETISGISWSIFYVGLGYVFGTAWKLALLWSSRLLLFIIIAFVVLTVVAWFWRWMLEQGKNTVAYLIVSLRSRWRTIEATPAVHMWMKKHAREIAFIKRRFRTQEFMGLPLTGLCIAVATSAGLFLGIVQDYLAGDPITFLDARLENLLYTFRTPELLSFYHAVTLLGDWHVVFGAGIALSIVLWNKHMRMYVPALWMNLLTCEAVVLGTKLLFHRPRPTGLLPALNEELFSFPSGHATIAAAFYGFLAYLYIRNGKEWKRRVSSFFAACLLIVSIDFSRLYLGVHYLSDVLAGNLVGLTTLFFAISFCEWFLWTAKKERSPRPFSFLPVGAVAVADIIGVVFITVAYPVHWNAGVPVADEKAVTLRNVLPLFADGSLPRYAETLLGARQEPVSFVIIGDTRCVLQAFDRAHWHRADQLSLDSSLKIAKATFFDEEFPSPPMSPAFYNSYPQDFGFEKESLLQGEHARHHARLWETPYETEEGRVFVATVTLDKRTKWTLMHSFEPDIDYDRQLLLQDLLSTRAIKKYRTVQFVKPGHSKNFVTDGKAEVVHLAQCAGPDVPQAAQ